MGERSPTFLPDERGRAGVDGPRPTVITDLPAFTAPEPPFVMSTEQERQVNEMVPPIIQELIRGIVGNGWEERFLEVIEDLQEDGRPRDILVEFLSRVLPDSNPQLRNQINLSPGEVNPNPRERNRILMSPGGDPTNPRVNNIIDMSPGS
jgi:hypothetical protein